MKNWIFMLLIIVVPLLIGTAFDDTCPTGKSIGLKRVEPVTIWINELPDFSHIFLRNRYTMCLTNESERVEFGLRDDGVVMWGGEQRRKGKADSKVESISLVT